MDKTIQRKDAIRLSLLQAIYRITESNAGCGPDIDQELANRIGATLDEARAAAEFLEGEGLIQMPYLGSFLADITHAGKVEAEKSIRDPSEGTEHFPSSVTFNLNNSVVGSIQAGGVGNVANVNQTVRNTVYQSVIDELRRKAETLPPEKHEEVRSIIEYIEDFLKQGAKAFAIAKTTIIGLVTFFGPEQLPWLTDLANRIS